MCTDCFLKIEFFESYFFFNLSVKFTCKFIKELVTMKVHVQLNAVARDAAGPRIRLGNISAIINQGTGPKPTEKLTT